MTAELSSVAARATLHAKRTTYQDILRSTMIIGGASALNVAIGMVRTKVMAVLLGPAGFGLMGVYTSIADLARSVAEMGINSSGVRQIAEAVGSGDANRIARTIYVLRRTAIGLGIISALLLVLFARPISNLTFGTDAHAGAVALLSMATFVRLVSDGQGALLQGMRRIADLARVGVLGALFGTAASIPIVYYLREDGVVPALVAIAAVSGLTSWWYTRKVRLTPCAAMTAKQVTQEASSLLKLGFAFMASGLLATGAAYVVRLIVIRQSGLEAAGLYQAAWALGGLYVGFILQAMGTDFYPRLVGVITDAPHANRLVNEQAQVSLLLAGPGVIATLTFASLVIALFYTREFVAAIGALRWICLGMALRVISWPMGYILVAKNWRLLFMATEVAWTVVNIGLSWACIRSFGLTGAGVAFAGSYVFHCVMVYCLVRRANGFRWTPANRLTGLLFICAIGTVFCAFETLPPLWATAVGVVALTAGSAYSMWMLLVLVPPDLLPRPIRRLRGNMQ